LELQLRIVLLTSIVEVAMPSFALEKHSARWGLATGRWSMSLVINTPTSHIGRALAVRLLDAGESVTLLSLW